MEKEIKKLKELADEYAKFVGRTPIECPIYLFGHAGDRNKIRLYFTKERKYSINFYGIEINEYSNQIEFPLNYTYENFEKIYNKAKDFLDKEKEKILESKEKEVKEEIEYLKRRLAELEKKQ